MKKIIITLSSIVLVLIIGLCVYLGLRDNLKTTYTKDDIKYVINNPYNNSATANIKDKGEIDFNNVEFKIEKVNKDDPNKNTYKIEKYKLKNKVVIYYYEEIID